MDLSLNSDKMPIATAVHPQVQAMLTSRSTYMVRSQRKLLLAYLEAVSHNDQDEQLDQYRQVLQASRNQVPHLSVQWQQQLLDYLTQRSVDPTKLQRFNDLLVERPTECAAHCGIIMSPELIQFIEQTSQMSPEEEEIVVLFDRSTNTIK